MNYSEVVLQSPGLDTAHKSGRCSIHAGESDFLSAHPFSSPVHGCMLSDATKIYESKLELSIPLATPALGRVKSGL